MKSLEEVIIMCKEKNHLDYNGLCGIIDDALFYLEEFQGLSKMWNDRLDKEYKHSPLTWNELKQLESKPIWLESSGELAEVNSWVLVRKVLSDRIYLVVGDFDGDFFVEEIALPKFLMGMQWNAYRKERHE